MDSGYRREQNNTGSHTHRQTDRQTSIPPGRQAGRQAGRRAYSWTDRQTYVCGRGPCAGTRADGTPPRHGVRGVDAT